MKLVLALLLVLVLTTTIIALVEGHAWYMPHHSGQVKFRPHAHRAADGTMKTYHTHDATNAGVRAPVPDSFECDVCLFMVAAVEDFVHTNPNINETAFHEKTNDLCLQEFEVWLAGFCMYVVDENALEFYDIVVKQDNPTHACAVLDLCPANTVQPQQKATKPPAVTAQAVSFAASVAAEQQTDGNKRMAIDDVEDPTNTFNFVLLSDTHIGESELATVLTESAVSKINNITKQEKIDFVFVTGDNTGSAQAQQWKNSKAIYDKLTVPYFPMMGNHDTWTYNSTYEERDPTGDAQFAAVFRDRFVNPGLPGAVLTYNNKTCYNPVHNITSWFQNWEMRYKGLIFLALDWNSRDHAVSDLGYKGAWPGAALQDFPGGTLPWLRERLSVAPSQGVTNVVLMQHHPFAMPWFLPEAIYSFPEGSVDAIRRTLDKYGPHLPYWGLLAGHLHIWYDGPGLADTSNVKNFRQWLTEGTKVSSAFTLVRVKNGKIAELKRMYGIDY